MSAVISVSDDLPVPVSRPVHSGKVRSVYFLRPEDSRRLIEQRAYAVPPNSDLALMVISDRLSAFDCLWQTQSRAGVPGKGAALNAIAAHWFDEFSRAGLLGHHLLEAPHPMVWVVRQAQPIKIEAIARRYLTGSLWRAYDLGKRHVAGVTLADGLQRYARLPELLFTPSTKGVMDNLEGVTPVDDAPVSPQRVCEHYAAFGLRSPDDLAMCERALREGFALIEARLAAQGNLLVDTKFEFGLAPAVGGGTELIYMDEVGTPDSSRIWERTDWAKGAPLEHSKEQFREALLAWVPDRELLLDADRMAERSAFAGRTPVPEAFFANVAETYTAQAKRITGKIPDAGDRPRAAILDLLNEEFRLAV